MKTEAAQPASVASSFAVPNSVFKLSPLCPLTVAVEAATSPARFCRVFSQPPLPFPDHTSPSTPSSYPAIKPQHHHHGLLRAQPWRLSKPSISALALPNDDAATCPATSVQIRVHFCHAHQEPATSSVRLLLAATASICSDPPCLQHRALCPASSDLIAMPSLMHAVAPELSTPRRSILTSAEAFYIPLSLELN